MITFLLIISIDTLTYLKLVGRGGPMFINSRINYRCRDDIKLDLEFIDVLAIEIPKD